MRLLIFPMILATVNKDNFLELHVPLDDTEKKEKGNGLKKSVVLCI